MTMHDTRVISHRSEHLLLDAKMAQRFVDDFHYVWQRPLKEASIKSMIRMINTGRFPLTALTLCQVDNDVRLIDGFHRCVSTTKASHPLRCTLLYYNVPSEEDRKALWAHFDTEPGTRRDAHEILKGIEEKDLSMIPSRIRSRLHSAMPFLLVGFSHSSMMKKGMLKVPMSRIERVELSRQFLQAGESLGYAMEGCNTAIRIRLTTSHNLAFCLAILRHCPRIAEPFLRSVALNDGLKREDPRHRFHEALLQSRLSGNAIVDHVRTLGYCWNLHVNNETRSQFRVPHGPIILKGTPYIIAHNDE